MRPHWCLVSWSWPRRRALTMGRSTSVSGRSGTPKLSSLRESRHTSTWTPWALSIPSCRMKPPPFLIQPGAMSSVTLLTFAFRRILLSDQPAIVSAPVHGQDSSQDNPLRSKDQEHSEGPWQPQLQDEEDPDEQDGGNREQNSDVTPSLCWSLPSEESSWATRRRLHSTKPGVRSWRSRLRLSRRSSWITSRFR